MNQSTSFRRCGTGFALVAAILLGACNGKSTTPPTPTTPTTPTTPATPALTAPTLKSPANAAELDTVRPTLEVNNAAATGAVGTVTYRFEISETSEFPEGSRTVVMDGVAQGSGSTSVTVPVDLQPNFVYSWRARATNGTITTSFSDVAQLKTQNKGLRNGQSIFDPLTNGASVADEIHGGHFVAGQGWQADGVNDSLDYNIPTCTSCQVEFDATNFDRSTPPADVDLKWFSMGNGATFGSFGAFRDDDWKMHIEKKSADGGAVKLIWRRGCQGSQSCDNTDNRKIPLAWEPAKVYHFTMRWGGGSMNVNICESDGRGNCTKVMYDATVPGNYAPPNHRVELGTRPRGETLTGTIWRNFKMGPR